MSCCCQSILRWRNISSKRPFKSAWYHQNLEKDKINIFYISVKGIKEKRWTAKQFVDWLLESHVHFILYRVHQGISQLGWDMKILEDELQRLKYHTGFPNGSQLLCPVFLQDKFQYIRAVPHIVNPTMKVQLDSNFKYSYAEPEFNRLVISQVHISEI